MTNWHNFQESLINLTFHSHVCNHRLALANTGNQDAKANPDLQIRDMPVRDISPPLSYTPTPVPNPPRPSPLPRCHFCCVIYCRICGTLLCARITTLLNMFNRVLQANNKWTCDHSVVWAKQIVWRGGYQSHSHFHKDEPI